MSTTRVVALTVCSLLLAGCSIRHEVRPVTGVTAGQEICIVEAPAVREGFLREMRAALGRRGFTTRLLPQGASPSACPVVVTYMARWSWDLTIYMSLAEITVYRDGRVDGVAKYDSTRGSANFGKFIDAEKKVNELVSQLFPEG